MTADISGSTIAAFRQQLDGHPLYQSVRTPDDLRRFMAHHVYTVWDFMSLIKYLQSVVAPVRVPWTACGDGNVRRFINELVLEEESDEVAPGEFSSHFELYLQAMAEVGADTGPAQEFVRAVQSAGIEAALALPSVPEPSRQFTRTTFDFIRGDKPHEVAAALALGREHIIPGMFRAILGRMGVTERDAPRFHFYLRRHIGLDEDFHAPLSLRLLNSLCQGDALRLDEAVLAARRAVSARLHLWDGVHQSLLARA